MQPLAARLQFVMGKGGVGRSTVTAALARRFVSEGHRTLVIQINAADRLSALLGVPAATSELAEVAPRLWSVNIEPEAAMREYVLMQVKLPIVYRLVFQNRAVSSFLKVVPALNDLLILGKIQFHVDETQADGTPRFERILIDAPATGHGLFLVDVPRVLMEAVSAGPIAREARRMNDLLHDPAQTAMHLVSTLEEMPRRETRDMVAQLGTRGLPLGALFLNAVPPRVFADEDEAHLAATEARLVDGPLKDTLHTLSVLAQRRGRLQRGRKSLCAAVALPVYTLSLVPACELGRDDLDAFVAAWRVQEGEGHVA